MPILFYLPLIVWISLFEVAQDEMHVPVEARPSTTTRHRTLSDKKTRLRPYRHVPDTSAVPFFDLQEVVRVHRDVPLPHCGCSTACLPRPASQCRSRGRGQQHCHAALRDGRLVIVVRHGATFRIKRIPTRSTSITSRLSETSTTKAEPWRRNFRRRRPSRRVPVGKVFTRKYNRAYQTPVITGFKDIEKTADITEGGGVAPNENSRRVDACAGY